MKKISLMLIVVFSGLSACDEKDLELQRGTIEGFVSLYDEFGYSLATKSGVKVTIGEQENQITTTTDESGKFSLSNVVAGSHDMTFVKDGFGTNKIFGIQLIGEPKPLVLTDISLHQMTTSELLSFDVNLAEEFEGAGFRILASATINPFATSRRSFIVFVHTTNAVSDKNYRWFKEMSIYRASGITDEVLFDNEFVSQFSSGTQLHLIGYPISTRQEGYFDPSYGLRIFSVGTPTAVKSITIP